MWETFFTYDGNRDADGWLGWESSFRRYMGDAPKQSSASESLRVLVAAKRGSLAAVLGGMIVRAWELDEEEDARGSGRVEVADDEDGDRRNVVASALPDSYWPWGLSCTSLSNWGRRRLLALSHRSCSMRAFDGCGDG